MFLLVKIIKEFLINQVRNLSQDCYVMLSKFGLMLGYSRLVRRIFSIIIYISDFWRKYRDNHVM